MSLGTLLPCEAGENVGVGVRALGQSTGALVLLAPPGDTEALDF